MAKKNTFNEPDWSVSQRAEDDCSSLNATGNTPFILLGIIVRLLQYHFSDANNIENTLLKEYLWVENRESSRIFIAPSYERENAIIQQRPALLVRREPTQVRPISIRDEALVSKNTNGGIYSGHIYQVELRGNHSIICVGGSGSEAESLGEEVFFRMLNFMPVIRDDIRIGSFRVEAISETQELPDEAGKKFYVVVRLSWATVYRWKTIPETPELKRITLAFTPFRDELITTGV
jgi:hypothetical protein